MTSKFEKRLKQLQLLPSTRQKYQEVINSADDDLISWIEKKVNARTPTGTILPLRAAIKHFLMAEHGYTEEELKELLPKAKGTEAEHHKALTTRQLAIYHAAVGEVDVDPAFTILSLLPVCGLRIGEITALHMNNVKWEGREVSFSFVGKGGVPREVPLPGAGIRAVERYVERMQPEGWLFTGYRGNPITPHALRIYTRKIAKDHPELEGLCPHRLRATYATMLMRRGVDLRRIQQAMGHKSITTTQRYVQPGIEDLRDAVKLLD